MSKAKRLWLVLLANLSIVLALVIVGLLSRSLGVLAAGGDYLGDAAGVALALLALRVSPTAHRQRASRRAARSSSSSAASTGSILLSR